MRDSHGRYRKEEELHFSCFLSSLIVTFLFKFNERSLTIGWGGGGGEEGPVLFRKRGPKTLSPSQVNSPKILPPPKCVPEKL